MATEERVELPGVLEHILRYCLKDAQETLQAGNEVVPFSAMAAGQTLFCEQHSFDSPEACFADARHTVEHARGSQGYGFCYDGYVDTDEGRKDALIAQGGVPGDPQGYAIGLVYTIGEDGSFTFEDEPIYVGSCENYMAALLPEEDDGETEALSEAEVGEDAEAAIEVVESETDEVAIAGESDAMED